MEDIPIGNWIPLGMTGAFAMASVFLGTPGDFAGNVALAIAVLTVGTYFWRKGAIGGGVVKVFAASSLWIGPNATFLEFTVVCAIGGLLLAVAARLINEEVKTVPYLPTVLLGLHICMPNTPMGQAIVDGLRKFV